MTRKPPQVPIVGDIWESKRDSARTVVVERVEWRTYRWGQRVHEVTYRTRTTSATRAQRHSTVTEVKKFQQQFRKHYEGLENL